MRISHFSEERGKVSNIQSPRPLQNLYLASMVFLADRLHIRNMRHLLNDLDRLQKEKADLEEEVRQLRAAIQLYTVVARKLAAEATTRPLPFAA